MKEPLLLPAEAKRLCQELKAPPRLVAHLRLVHDVACQIVAGLQEQFPTMEFDGDAVCFGAAIHDLGKCIHSSELTGPGKRHEEDGSGLLEAHGVPPHLARFARTHGTWNDESLLEDLLVSLADAVWKGQRIEDLEELVVRRIAKQTGQEEWNVFSALDLLLTEIASWGRTGLRGKAKGEDVTYRFEKPTLPGGNHARNLPARPRCYSNSDRVVR